MTKHKRKKASIFDGITLEGGLISSAMLGQIAERKAGQQTEADYGVPRGLVLRDEIARYYRIGEALFRDLNASANPSAAATLAFTEELLRSVLGFADLKRHDGDGVALEAAGGRVVVVVVPPSDKLDESSDYLTGHGRRRSAASALQDWLNRHENCLWGLCGNGERLRLLRDNASLTRPAYVEVNFRQIFEGENFADFAAAWLLLHASRFGAADAAVTDCQLERWREAGAKEGLVARERLRDGVEAALLALGNGFLAHAENGKLRARLANGELALAVFFGQLLRLVYRMIFLLVAEDRGLLHAPGTDSSGCKLYAEGYGLAALRERAVRRTAWDRYYDRWEGLLITFQGLAEGEPKLGLPTLGGLFENIMADLEGARLSNKALMEAVYRLAWLKDEASLLPVNWRDMETEELGSVYESLLELTPLLVDNGRGFAFAQGDETKGNQRKKTGSYYTPDSLVQTLLDNALDPVLDRVESEAKDRVQGLLGVTVIDPACGSGHFLLAAARRIATRVARARTGGVAAAKDYQHALRDVVRTCIHGVDRNPMAVELAKVALWIETVEPGRPLGFLDGSILCGDSLLGVFDLEVLRKGIPDAAYKPLTGDDKTVCKDFLGRNRDEHSGQAVFAAMGGTGAVPAAPPLGAPMAIVKALPEDSTEQIAEKRRRLAAAKRGEQLWNWREAADLYMAAFLLPKKETPKEPGAALVPTTDHVWRKLRGRQVYGPLAGVVAQVAQEARLFHWPMEFPDVMARGGFDVVIGNPPWERIKIQEQEFFSARAPEIAMAATANVRGGLILSLRNADDAHRRRLFSEFELAKRIAEASSLFARESGRFPKTGRGDINTYALFTELFTNLAGVRGRAGVIVPTGIATDATTAIFFAWIIESRRLAQLIDFENRDGIFPAVHRSYKFSLLTVGYDVPAAGFAFCLTTPAQLREPERHFTFSSEQIAVINPNTKTALISRSRIDAELTSRIHGRVPVLVDAARGTAGNLWAFRYMTKMFDMADSSAQFRTAEELATAGFERDGVDWVPAKLLPSASEPSSSGSRAIDAADDQLLVGRYVPLYEAKMISLFDHRATSYAERGSQRGNRVLPETTDQQHRDQDYEVEPFYWVLATDLKRRIERTAWTRPWLMGWKDVTTAATERTVVATAFPKVAVGHTIRLMFADGGFVSPAVLIVNLSSLVLDYVARQKVSYLHLTVETLTQLPILPPSAYDERALDYILPRLLELVYTSHAMASFARDLGFDGQPFTWDEDHRALLRAELDAWYARAYGLKRDELRYILDPADVMGEDYPSETFRVLKNSEMKKYGEYRTRRLVLEAWDRMEAGDLK